MVSRHLEHANIVGRLLGDSSIRVAIIDSGIDIDHPDLSGKTMAPYDAFSDDEDPSPNPESTAGPEATQSVTNTVLLWRELPSPVKMMQGLSEYVQSVPSSQLKCWGTEVVRSLQTFASFEHAIVNNAAVINNSWGYTEPIAAPQPLVDIIQRAQTETRNGKGSVVVFASGNDNREIFADELCDRRVLCVLQSTAVTMVVQRPTPITAPMWMLRLLVQLSLLPPTNL